MRFLISFLVTSALCASNTYANSNENEEVEYTSIDSTEKVYFKSVLDTCSADVQTLCTHVTDAEEAHRRMEQAQADDVLPPFFATLGHHRTLIDEFDTFFDSFIRPNSHWVVVYENEQPANQKPPCPKLAAQAASMQHEHDLVRNIALNFHPSTFDFVSERLQTHGNDLLSSGSTLALTEPGRRMARRLSAVTASELHSVRNSFLPFHDTQNECLDRLYHYNPDQLSDPCRFSVHGLYTYRRFLKNRTQSEEDNQMKSIWFVLGIYAMTVVSVIFTIRRNKDRLQREQRLQELILTAVYNSPELKRLVELKAGESLGFEPPFPPQIRAQRAMRKKKGCERYNFAVMVLFFVYIFLCTFGARFMDIVTFYSLIVTAYATYTVYTIFIRKVDEPICTCCCCEMTTKMARLGLGSKAQVCCGCCQGTGVCSTACSSCCGPDSEDDNEDGDCPCCPMEPVCTCCCCAMTTEMAKLGVGTKEQECCGCCQGTGVCSTACSSCCGPHAVMIKDNEKRSCCNNDDKDSTQPRNTYSDDKNTTIERDNIYRSIQIV